MVTRWAHGNKSVVIFTRHNVVQCQCAGADRIESCIKAAGGHWCILVDINMTLLGLNQLQLVDIARTVGAQDIWLMRGLTVKNG